MSRVQLSDSLEPNEQWGATFCKDGRIGKGNCVMGSLVDSWNNEVFS